MRKWLVGLVLALMVAGQPVASADSVSDEAQFVSLINGLRASKGLPTLEVHVNLVDKARGWAATMGAQGRIWHSTLHDGITADWIKLGENVGMGGDVETLHKAFIASPKHYENLVDPGFGYIGIGIVYVDGTLYVSEMFMTLNTPAPTTTTTARPPAPAPAPVRARPASVPKPAPKPAPAPVPVAAPPAPEPPPPPPPPVPSPLLVSVLESLRILDI